VVSNHPSDLLPAYALDCLDDAEARTLAGHLALCALCRRELEAYRQTAHALALTAPQTEPPASVRQKLLEEVQAWSSQPVVAVDNRLRPLPWRQLPASALSWQPALLLLLLLLLLSNLYLWQQFNRLRQEAPPRAVVTLMGAETAPQASGVLVLTADGRQATLIVEGMPPLPAGQQYQLWLIENGQRSDGGVFSVDIAGYHTMPVTPPRPITDYNAFGVTIEPAGGSPGPTGPRVLGGAH
jgi:anti-sigma-K factor RskA